jgi:hypothetical protein
MPLHELWPQHLLLRLPVESVAEAAMADDVSEVQLGGAARFLSSHDYYTEGKHKVFIPQMLDWSDQAVFTPDPPGRAPGVPDALRERLLAHCLASQDEDKVARGRAAFS